MMILRSWILMVSEFFHADLCNLINEMIII